MTEMTKRDDLDEVVFDDVARQKLLEGAGILARAVETTLGPRGRNVIIEQRGGKHILTKDGVTVARAVNLRDPYQQMGCQLIRDVAQRTNDVAGDGTTTATTLAYAIFSGGMRLLAAKHPAVEIKRGIDGAVVRVVAALRGMAMPVDDDEAIVDVGTISANGEREIGQLLAQAMSRVGRDGVIAVEDAKGLKTSLEVVDGARFDRGFLSSYFVTDADRMTCELNDPLVLVSNLRFSAIADVIPFLETVNEKGRSLLVIGDDVEGEMLQLMVTNHMRGTLKCCAIRAPAFGEHRVDMLHDIAALLGGKLITAGDRLNTPERVERLIDEGVFGTCKRVVIDKARTTFIGAVGDRTEVERRAASIREQMVDPTLSVDGRGMLQERLGKLASGVAILRVGGATEIELIERKYRVEDALNATQAAVEEGIVPGGGVALVRAARAAVIRGLPPAELFGAQLIEEACHVPLRRIVQNAGGTDAAIVEARVKKSTKPSMGYDASRDAYVDVLEAGILDPVKVTRCALENAASVAGLMLTASALVLDTVNDDPMKQFR